MFTGLVDHRGTVTRVGPAHGGAAGRTFQVDSAFRDFVLGESIACDGVCLTVESWSGGAFTVTAGTETLNVTTLGALRPGDAVHLERAMRLGDRLGGHIVQGHVDGVGEVVDVTPSPVWTRVEFRVPAGLARYIAPKGSVTVDGVSLTVNEVTDRTFAVGLVPHTLTVTKLGAYRVGTRVNIETDLLARYLERLIQPLGADPAGVDPVSVDLLRRAGFSG